MSEKDNTNKKEKETLTSDDTITITSKDANGKEELKVDIKKGGKRKKLSDLELEIKKLKNDLLRNQADFENYKKRINQEKIADRKYAAMNIIHDLLIPLDQLDKVVNMEVKDNALKNYLIGFKMINDQIFTMLEQNGVTPIKALNELFDPNIHHAVEKDSNKEIKNGIITEEIQKGYMYKDRILRPAMVKVNEWSD